MSAQPDLKYTEAGEEEEPPDSALYFQKTPASEMDHTALLMCVVSLREVGGWKCGKPSSD